MTPEQWREIKAVLQGALELAPAERGAYLEQHPGAVRSEVESLLRAYELNKEFLEAPCLDIPAVSTHVDPELIGRHFGPYRVLSLLGQGGMGSVWLAERVDGMFTRQVALKLVHPALMGRVMTERVAREREILASLNHPNIARLFDAGFAEDGQPYLALEYISGTPLTTYCDEHRLSIRERLELFREVLGAVQYAHAHLVIHRDLKPSNILVSEEGRVHLLDFGVAKLLTAGEAKETALTQFGGRAMTPDYAAPEQISGAPITTAADVYALGVMLYELLTGEPPYRLKRDSRGALEEAILQTDPAAPSRVALSETAAQARGTSAKKLARALRGDLDTITGKALKKYPSERYATANAFDEDVARSLSGEVVLAQRDSVAYRALKFMRRHRVAIAGVSALILALAGGLAATTYEAQVASAQRDAAAQAQLRSLTQTAAARLRDFDVAGAMGIILEVLPHQGARRPYTPEALSVFQEARAADVQIMALTGHDERVWFATFSPDGRRIATASWDKTARLWDTLTGTEITRLSGHAGRVFSVSFSPDGRRIVTASSDNTARIWDAETGRELMTLSGHARQVMFASFSPDGRSIVTASTDKTARIWDAETGRQIMMLADQPGRFTCVAFSPDSRRVVTGADDNIARVWDAATGRQIKLLSGHTDRVWRVAFSPDGSRIVTASQDKSARIWDVATGQEILRLIGHSDRVNSAWFSPDGRRVVTASDDKTVRVWDATTAQQILLLSGHTDRVWSAVFSPDGRRVVTTSTDKTARIWDVSTAQQIALLSGHTQRVWNATYSPDGSRAVTASSDKTARIWDVASGQEIVQLIGHGDPVNTAVFSLDAKRIATSSDDKTARIWDAATGRQLMLLTGHTDTVSSVAFSPDGGRVVTASHDKTARIWDSQTGRTILVLSGHTDRVWSAVFSPDGTRVVTSSTDKTARIWDAVTGREIMVLSGHARLLPSVEYSPDGTHIVTASADRTARIWDAATGQQIVMLSGHGSGLTFAAFSRDGELVVTASDDKTARLWDAATGRQIMLLAGHTGAVESAVFSPDGRRILTASEDATARIWDASAVALEFQIGSAEAAQFDLLESAERFQLGLPAPTGVRQWPMDNSKCDQAAAAPYDPDRRAPGLMLDQVVASVAVAACTEEKGRSVDSASIYQRGRAQMASGKSPEAMRDFEDSLAHGYRAAGIDLARLLQGSAGTDDVRKAISLYERAWSDGVTIAAFDLGNLYEHGVKSAGNEGEFSIAPDDTRSWSWYEKAAEAGEPNALARLAERATRTAFSEQSDAKRNSDLLESFKYYAAASERAYREDWPDDSWRNWRYRRASLARLLAREGMMQEVAQAYDHVRRQYARPRATLWERLTSFDEGRYGVTSRNGT
ncbi:MAG: protein kinase domain-containing protein [Steroidobacteraceae bacterium]